MGIPSKIEQQFQIFNAWGQGLTIKGAADMDQELSPNVCSISPGQVPIQIKFRQQRSMQRACYFPSVELLFYL